MAGRDWRRLSLQGARCYNSGANQDRFGVSDPPLPTFRYPQVLINAAEGRRLARRAIAWQAVAIAATALAFLAKDVAWGVAAALGGAAIAVGGWLAGVIALGGGVNPSTVAVARLMAGVGLKWAVAIMALLVGIGLAGLPPLAMVVGVIVALVAQMLAMAGPVARH